MKIFFTIFIITILILLVSYIYAQDSMSIENISYRPPVVAGSFYPEDPAELNNLLRNYLDLDGKKHISQDIKAIVVPHAGYVFSGKTAAMAYRELYGRHYDAVIILAPSHQVMFSGASAAKLDAYVTPLGNALIDKELTSMIAQKSELINLSLDGHDWRNSKPEHSLEVQIPFLQIVLPNTPIVPIVIGTQNHATVNALLKAVTESAKESKKEILIVASTDLSHFHSIDEAKQLDRNIVSGFEHFDYFKLSVMLFNRSWEACGAAPLVTAMMASEQMGATKAIPLMYTTSGDVPAGMSRQNSVVGYLSGALVVDETTDLDILPVLNESQQQALFDEAVAGVKNAVSNKKSSDEKPIYLDIPGQFATFVTIKKHGQLRACMGHTFSQLPLAEEVRETSKLASLNDYRFGPVKESEMQDLSFEITVMSRMRRILDTNELLPGRDGIFIRLHNNTGLFLPQVATEQNWDLTQLLENICRKAGLPINSYKDPNTEIYTFKAVIIHQ